MTSKKERIHIIMFTVGITAFFGFLVAGLESALLQRKEMNQQVANQKVILQLFGLKPLNEEWDNQKVLAEFAKSVEKVQVAIAEQPNYFYYRLKLPNDAKICVVPFKGRGFWDTIAGYFAIDLATKKLKSIDFTIHSETPGLGGRISEPSFKKRFVDLPLESTDENGKIFKFVPEGSKRPDKPSEIDGLTGASETCRAVETFLNKALSNFLSIVAKEGK